MAVAEVPGLMVTVSKTPEEAVAVVLHPLADRVTRPPGATVEGVTREDGLTSPAVGGRRGGGGQGE